MWGKIESKTEYYKVTTSHEDWGRDSIDSIENSHICSDGCLGKIFAKYINENEYDTKKLEVEKIYCDLKS